MNALADDPTVPRSAYVSTAALGDAGGGLVSGLVYIGATMAAGAVVASGGAIAIGMLAAALAGGGVGLLGTLLARGIGRHHAAYLQQQIERGGLLLWVRVMTNEDESRAVSILRRNAADAVHVHPGAVEPDTVNTIPAP